jgi:hypothetical protein
LSNAIKKRHQAMLAMIWGRQLEWFLLSHFFVLHKERQSMEVHQLRYFCAIVSYGTFTRAAKAQHVSQPSLSQQILKLEDELGGKLFYRLPRAARLTALGEIFLPRALAVLQEIRNGKAEVRKIVALQRSEPVERGMPMKLPRQTDTPWLDESRVRALPESAWGVSHFIRSLALRLPPDVFTSLKCTIADGSSGQSKCAHVQEIFWFDRLMFSGPGQYTLQPGPDCFKLHNQCYW